MQFNPPLARGVLLRRYKRFLADVQTASGETLTLHCPNTGAMANCCPAGAAILYSRSQNAKRKYPCTWEAVQVAYGHWAGINTGRANALVAEAVARGVIPRLPEAVPEREVNLGDSRFDLAFGDRRDPHTIVEIKSVTLGPGEDDPDHGVVMFPDARTLRGQKHLRALGALAASGRRAILFFCVQHTGARVVRPADQIDPCYGQLLRDAVAAGVEVLAWRTSISPAGMCLEKPLRVDLDEPQV